MGEQPTFWQRNRKLLVFLVSAAAIIATALATLGCGYIPMPLLRGACVSVANALIAEGKRDALGESNGPEQTLAQRLDAAPLPAPTGQGADVRDPAAELCPGGSGGPLCLSNGYALPLPDGGACRCK